LTSFLASNESNWSLSIFEINSCLMPFIIQLQVSMLCGSCKMLPCISLQYSYIFDILIIHSNTSPCCCLITLIQVPRNLSDVTLYFISYEQIPVPSMNRHNEKMMNKMNAIPKWPSNKGLSARSQAGTPTKKQGRAQGKTEPALF
jgi:hypothetical protein